MTSTPPSGSAGLRNIGETQRTRRRTARPRRRGRRDIGGRARRKESSSAESPADQTARAPARCGATLVTIDGAGISVRLGVTAGSSAGKSRRAGLLRHGAVVGSVAWRQRWKEGVGDAARSSARIGRGGVMMRERLLGRRIRSSGGRPTNWRRLQTQSGICRTSWRREPARTPPARMLTARLRHICRRYS